MPKPTPTFAPENTPFPPYLHRAAQGWYIGLMSGTSLDGVDAVLARFSPRVAPGLGEGDGWQHIEVGGHLHLPFDAGLVAALRQLNFSGPDELHLAALAENALAQRYTEVVQQLCQQAGVRAADVVAIGAHGQTVRHQPYALQEGDQAEQARYTIQLNNPAWLAEHTGMTVVADFRRRDMAAGGQGAPLVPAFHRALFGQPGQGVAVLNLGGIANWSLIDRDGQTIGFDSGPANTLLDGWCQQQTGARFDENGQWAASGTPIPVLLAQCLQEPYFALPAPKSTGVDLFSLPWLQTQLALAGLSSPPKPEDVQATLVELTAASIAHAFARYHQGQRRVGVCGGGAYNSYLLRRIAQHLHTALGHTVEVHSTADWGLGPEQVEAAAFAWLARQCLLGLPGNVPAATHARGARILGAIYPA